MIIRTTLALTALVAGPAAAHTAETPHLHSHDFGAVLIGTALIALAGGAAFVQARARSRR